VKNLALNLHCVLFEMKCTLYHVNKSFLQCISCMCLFRENRRNEQKGQNPKINKRAGENKSKQRGKMLKINKRACSFI
jgi:hypothetical protein